MSYLPPHDPQQPPGYPPPYHWGQAVPQPAPPGKSKLPWIIGGAVAAFVIFVGGAVGVTVLAVSHFASTGDPAATKPLTAWEQEQRDLANGSGLEDESGVFAEPATPGPVLSAADITLKAKVTDKQCFGSAGCNVMIKVDMTYTGPELSPDETWEVTYEVKGDEDGPIIGTFAITGDEYTVNEEILSTRSRSTKVSIKVTDVAKAGE